MNTYIFVSLAIDGQLRSDFDIGVMELGEFLLPVGVFKLEVLVNARSLCG